MEKDKADLAKKKLKKRNVSTEEMALSELRIQLARKGITPEGFFRLCDVDYTQSVST